MRKTIRNLYLLCSNKSVFEGHYLLPGDRSADRLALHHGLLLPLGEQRDFVVDILQHDEDSRLTGQLLGAIVLKRLYLNIYF